MTIVCMRCSCIGDLTTVPSPCMDGYGVSRRARVPQGAPAPVGRSARCGGVRAVGPEVCEDGEDATVVVLVRREFELGEDRRHVLLDRPLRNCQPLADRAVRAPFGHEL